MLTEDYLARAALLNAVKDVSTLELSNKEEYKPSIIRQIKVLTKGDKVSYIFLFSQYGQHRCECLC